MDLTLACVSCLLQGALPAGTEYGEGVTISSLILLGLGVEKSGQRDIPKGGHLMAGGPGG